MFSMISLSALSIEARGAWLLMLEQSGRKDWDSSSLDETLLRKLWRILALNLHPDRNPGVASARAFVLAQKNYKIVQEAIKVAREKARILRDVDQRN